MSLAPGDRVELEIERLAAGGDGVAHADGLAVFVPLAAPGDRVRARVVARESRFARAEIEEVLAPGPGRREPPCPYYGRCGGCTWLHLSADEQARARVAILRDAFARIAQQRELPEPEWVESPVELGYRSRARVAFSAPERVGFRARASHEVIDIERCAVLDPATQRELERLRRAPLRGRGEQEIRGYGSTVKIASVPLQVGPEAFFQANRALWERWQALVLDACGTGDSAVELYCGVGFYTVGLCARFARVVALERSVAARDARRNTRARVVEAAAEDWAPRELAKLAPELVLLNPPRVGCHNTVSKALCDSGARRIVYVSCDAATLARDVARIGAGFRIARLFVIDALPQTHHVETLAVLEAV